MDSKNILILGNKGFLGSYLFRYLKSNTDHSVIGVNRTSVCDGVIDFSNDIECGEQIKLIAEKRYYDIVVNCVAMVSAEQCHNQLDLSFLINAQLNQILANAFPNAKIIHISTDSVYSGVPVQYRSSFAVRPRTSYGVTKAVGDLLLSHFSRDFHIIRCCPVGFSMSGRSFADWIVNSTRHKEVITLFRDVMFSPVSLNQISRLVVLLISSKIDERIINFGGVKDFTKSEFGFALLEYMGLTTTYLKAGEALDKIRDKYFNGHDQRIKYDGDVDSIKKIVIEDLFQNICNDENWQRKYRF